MDSSLLKDEFENTTSGHIGVVQRNPEGKLIGTTVKPGESVLLDEAEQIATANAPKRDEDNPLANGSLKKIRDGTEIKNRRPLGPPQGEPVNVPDSDREQLPELDANPDPDAPSVEGRAKAAEETPEEREAKARAAIKEAEEREARQAKEAAERAEAAKKAVAREEKADVRPDPEAKREVGAAKKPAGKPAEGKSAKGEEVATPKAPAAAKG